MLNEKWLLEIDGHLEDLERIRENTSETSFQVIRNNNKYFMRSNIFNEFDNLEDVLDKGQKIVTIINGIAKINLNFKGSIKLVGVLETHEEIHENIRHIKVKGKITVSTDTNEPYKIENSIELWLRLAEENQYIRKVFRLLNYGLNSYVNTFRICEIIKKDSCKLFEKYKNDMNRLTGTANRTDYAGDLARHGVSDNNKPMSDDPMSLGEASEFTEKILYEWIHSKIDGNLNNEKEQGNSIIKNKWIVQITGNQDDLEQLCNIKIDTFRCFEINKNYYIAHKEFEEYENLEDVLDYGEDIVRVLNGIAKINLNLKGNIEVIGVSEYLENMNEIAINHGAEDLETAVIIRTELNNEKRSDNLINKWIQLAEKNENIEKVFILLNYGLHCYVNIWRIFELSEKDLGKKYISVLGTTKKKRNRLKDSADNPNISGDLARHGVSYKRPIANPMNISEASNFTYELIYKWIHFRIKKDEII